MRTARFVRKLQYLFSVPISIVFLLHSGRIHPAYKLTWWKRIVFGLRVFRNKHRIPTGNGYQTALMASLKLFEMSPDVPGVVVECGTWKGGLAASLSLACQIVGRKLVICDSFEGLPPGDTMDREAKFYQAGDYCGSLDEVRANIGKYGALECCEFIKGWFEDTLPHFDKPIVMAFVDVDLESSLNTCIIHLWPWLDKDGYVLIDEYIPTDYCSLFYSERFWKENFNRTPPGLIGAGSGLALGQYYIGPFSEKDDHPLQVPTGPAYTRKSMSGCWTYFPNDRQAE